MTASPSVVNARILGGSFIRSYQLQDSCVDVWKVSLGCSEADLAHAHQILSLDEQRRAAQIGSKPMRSAFIGARAALRSLLGLYLHRMPSTIRFTYEAHGKPGLCGDAGVRFSAARSGEVAAFAFCSKMDVGIDLERFRILPSMDRVVERMFSPGERQQFHLLPSEQKQRAFFACWTRKEAYAKATGQGILTRFDNFSVDADPDEPKPEIRFDGIPTAAEVWVLHDLRLADEYAAALAYQGAERTISIFDAGTLNHLIGREESLECATQHG
jgi:4'-phosphopantetheinyl transferase